MELWKYLQTGIPPGACEGSRPLASDAVTAAALQHLEKEFGRSKLIKAKVAFEDRDGLLRSSCDGLGPVGMVCPLRTSTDARPFDLVSQAGCLSGTLPVCTALEDGRIRNSINRTLANPMPSGSPLSWWVKRPSTRPGCSRCPHRWSLWIQGPKPSGRETCCSLIRLSRAFQFCTKVRRRITPYWLLRDATAPA